MKIGLRDVRPPDVIVTLCLGACLLGTWGCPKANPPTERKRVQRVLLHDDDGPGLSVDGITLLGSLELAASLSPEIPLHELSGLAWDKVAGHLWAVSDRGYLFALLPLFDGGTLVDLHFRSATRLQSEGQSVSGDERDAEGLVLFTETGPLASKKGERRLAVSYEQTPRIVVHDFSGRDLRTVHSPKLENLGLYDEPNHALEALGFHKTFGFITAPERSPQQTTRGQIPIWRAKDAAPLGIFVGLGSKKAAVVALEALADGQVLILERRFRRKGRRLQSALSLVTLTEGTKRLPVRHLVTLDTKTGWRHDNYEGLTHHQGNRFFMVSDDNGGAPQRTLLTYFAIPSLATGGNERPGSASEKPIPSKDEARDAGSQ